MGLHAQTVARCPYVLHTRPLARPKEAIYFHSLFRIYNLTCLKGRYSNYSPQGQFSIKNVSVLFLRGEARRCSSMPSPVRSVRIVVPGITIFPPSINLSLLGKPVGDVWFYGGFCRECELLPIDDLKAPERMRAGLTVAFPPLVAGKASGVCGALPELLPLMLTPRSEEGLASGKVAFWFPLCSGAPLHLTTYCAESAVPR